MNFRTALIAFSAALAIEIVAIVTGSQTLEFIAKPVLMPILVWYFASSTKPAIGPRNALLGALFFSWIGDVALMFDKYNGGLFIYGLGGFLIAHFCYIFYFLKIRTFNGIRGLPPLIAVIPIAFYGAALFGFVSPFVGPLIVPVAVYAAVITTMMIASVAAFRFEGEAWAKLCVAGTALFLVSDSVLALNRFVFPIPVGHAIVMLTYGAAQFLITEGARRNLAHLSGSAKQ